MPTQEKHSMRSGKLLYGFTFKPPRPPTSANATITATVVPEIGLGMACKGERSSLLHQHTRMEHFGRAFAFTTRSIL